MSRKKVAALCLLLFWAALFDAAIFVVAGCLMHGFAYEGRVADGHYYLGVVAKNWRKSHETEVSRQIFVYSRIHGWIVLATVPVGIFAAFLAGQLGEKRPEGRTG